MLKQNLQELRLGGRTRTFLQDRRSLTEPGYRLVAETSYRREHRRGRTPKRENRRLTLPESGWEREAAGPLGSKTPTAASPTPGQTVDRNPQETPPAGQKDGRRNITRDHTTAGSEAETLTLKNCSLSATSDSSVRTSEWKFSTVLRIFTSFFLDRKQHKLGSFFVTSSR